MDDQIGNLKVEASDMKCYHVLEKKAPMPQSENLWAPLKKKKKTYGPVPLSLTYTFFFFPLDRTLHLVFKF